MHSMILRDKSGKDLEFFTPQVVFSSFVGLQRAFTFANLTWETTLIEDIDTYYNLRDDLVQHL